jgi:hypothetical protein
MSSHRVVPGLVFACLLLIMGCGTEANPQGSQTTELTDQEFSERLVGTWYMAGKVDNIWCEIFTVFSKGGSLKQVVRGANPNGREINIQFQGTWKVMDGNLIQTLEETNVRSSGTNSSTWKYKLLSVTKAELRYLTPEGVEVKQVPDHGGTPNSLNRPR